MAAQAATQAGRSGFRKVATDDAAMLMLPCRAPASGCYCALSELAGVAACAAMTKARFQHEVAVTKAGFQHEAAMTRRIRFDRDTANKKVMSLWSGTLLNGSLRKFANRSRANMRSLIEAKLPTIAPA